MSMLFVTDQHHMDDLEQKVMMIYGREHSIRLMGDMSPTQILEPHKPKESTFLKLRRLVSKEKKKKEDRRFEEAELPVELKMELDAENIREADDEAFLKEWVCLYGGASIANLARKYFANAFLGEKAICLSGSEPIIDNAQRNIYDRIINKKGMPAEEVMNFIWGAIKEKLPWAWDIVSRQLGQSGIEGEHSKFVLKELSPDNYKGKIPTASDVYKGHPVMEKVEFKEKIYWEKAGNCAVIHVPYFNNDRERYDAMHKSMPELYKFLDSTKGNVVIAYHGNPYPEGMDDEKTKRRRDYNKIVIEDVANVVFQTIAKDTEVVPEMLCGHLHKSNKPYDWQIGSRKIKLYPLGIRDLAFLDTNSGKIDMEEY